MIDKDFCLSSYMAYRFTYNDCEYYEGMHHENYQLLPKEQRKPVRSAEEIDQLLQVHFDQLHEKYDKIGILLSGGMDSAILSSYLKPGCHAYTFTSDTGVFDADLARAKDYCERFGLVHHIVDITFDDFKQLTPIVMKGKGGPVHSIEPQIYKAAMTAKHDGVEIMIIGDAADYVFCGMDRLYSKDWQYDEFVKRYVALDPNLVLTHPKGVYQPFEPFRMPDGKIDFVGFLDGIFVIESYGSYHNAFSCAGMTYVDPYEDLVMAEPFDLKRIRSGDSKYLIRDLYRLRMSGMNPPEKLPMPRPVDAMFRDWAGPRRSEFRSDIPMETLTGNQKWQLWCAEQFLNIYDKQ